MATGEGSRPLRLRKGDGISLGLQLLLGGVARAAFVTMQELPNADPWRHLLLIDALRSGRGFSLFDGQPYLWYPPLWHALAAAVPLEPDHLAAALSLLAGPVLYLHLRRCEGASIRAASLTGLLMALSGPWITFTCHYGPEALALLLLLSGLLLALSTAGRLPAFVAGLLAGVGLVARMNLLFNLLLFLPAVRQPRRALWLGLGGAIPVALSWWRNHRILAAHEWVFTWDGLATRASEYGPVSTLLLQMHPSVGEALRRLHEQIVPLPQWLVAGDRVQWPLIVFVAAGVGCVAASRHWPVILATTSTMAYYLFLDRTLSANFFRIWVGLFPLFFLALGLATTRHGDRRSLVLGAAAAVVLLLAGAPLLVPVPMQAIEDLTPPPELLQESSYLANSAFYHPECLQFRFRERRFLGMPLRPEEWDEFRAAYPRVEAVLWRDAVSVQEPLLRFLIEERGWVVRRRARNAAGLGYRVLTPGDR